MSKEPQSLLDRTLELLRAAEESYLEIYRATELTPSWLAQLSRGKIEDPSVNKIQRLYEHLAGDRLKY